MIYNIAVAVNGSYLAASEQPVMERLPLDDYEPKDYE